MPIDIVVYNASEDRLTEQGAFEALTQGLQWGGNEGKNFTLFSYGCLYHDAIKTCTAVCLDPDLIFTDLPTLANCIAYPWISQSISKGNLTILGQAIADQFDIRSITAYPEVTTAIVQIQNKCWNQWITHADSTIFTMNSPEWSELCGG